MELTALQLVGTFVFIIALLFSIIGWSAARLCQESREDSTKRLMRYARDLFYERPMQADVGKVDLRVSNEVFERIEKIIDSLIQDAHRTPPLPPLVSGYDPGNRFKAVNEEDIKKAINKRLKAKR